MAPAEDAEIDELAEALRQSRDRFIAAFPTRCVELQLGFSTLAVGTPAPEALRQIAHKLTGLAGTVGFPSVSRVASDLETRLTSASSTKAELLENLAALRVAFSKDSVEPIAPVEVVITPPAAAGLRILVIDDDTEQRAITTRTLERGGYDVVALPSADTVLETAERVRPAAILLDVMMPGIGGHLACRLLKAEPSVADVPVMFVSSNAALDERLAGLALGAADYVAKPYDVNELLFRVKRVIENRVAPPPPALEVDNVLDYPSFAARAAPLLAEPPCTLALLKVDPKGRDHLARTLVAETRRRDVIAQFDRMHLVMLLPGLQPAAVGAQLAPVLERVTRSGVDARAGLAAGSLGTTTLDALVQEADEALAAARFHGLLIGQKGDQSAVPAHAGASQLILLADDDPDVTRIVDAQMRSLHFATTLAFDGHAALAALSANPVSLVILDLMLPKVTGFEILHRLREAEARPRMIVLSAKGREEDITRAFELGADDYITKPFRPQELAARVVRLLR